MGCLLRGKTECRTGLCNNFSGNHICLHIRCRPSTWREIDCFRFCEIVVENTHFSNNFHIWEGFLKNFTFQWQLTEQWESNQNCHQCDKCFTKRLLWRQSCTCKTDKCNFPDGSLMCLKWQASSCAPQCPSVFVEPLTCCSVHMFSAQNLFSTGSLGPHHRAHHSSALRFLLPSRRRFLESGSMRLHQQNKTAHL